MVDVGRFEWPSEVKEICEKGFHIEEGTEKDGQLFMCFFFLFFFQTLRNMGEFEKKIKSGEYHQDCENSVLKNNSRILIFVLTF